MELILAFSVGTCGGELTFRFHIFLYGRMMRKLTFMRPRFVPGIVLEAFHTCALPVLRVIRCVVFDHLQVKHSEQ